MTKLSSTDHLTLAERFLERPIERDNARLAVEHALRAYDNATGAAAQGAARLVARGLEWAGPAADAVAWHQLAGDDLDTAWNRVTSPVSRPPTDAVDDAIAETHDLDPDSARAAFDELYRRAGLTVPQRVAILRARATLESECRDRDASIAFLRQAADIAPDNLDVLLELAMDLYNAKQDDEALATYRRALHLGEPLGQAIRGLGTVLLTYGRFAEAETAFRKALELRPADCRAHHRLAGTLLKQNRPGEARPYICRAAQLGYDGAWTLAERYHIAVPSEQFAAGNDKLGHGDPTAAIEFFDACIAAVRPHVVVRGDVFSRQLAAALSNKAFALGQLGRWDEAEPRLREALEHRPGLVDAHNHLGNALAETGRLEQAVGAFRRCGELDRSYAGAPYGEAGALERLGRYDDAIAAIERAIEIGYEHPAQHADLERRKQYILGRANR